MIAEVVQVALDPVHQRNGMEELEVRVIRNLERRPEAFRPVQQLGVFPGESLELFLHLRRKWAFESFSPCAR